MNTPHASVVRLRGGAAFPGFFLLLLSLIVAAPAAAHEAAVGDYRATFDPERGLVELSFQGQQVQAGSTTQAGGAYFSLTREAPAKDFELHPSRDGEHFISNVGRITNKLSGKTPRIVRVERAEADRYTVSHRYAGGVTLIFDHKIVPPDIELRVTVENDSRDYFQLLNWTRQRLIFDRPPTEWVKMREFYPSGAQYSPIVCAWGDNVGVGINWVEHRMRPVEVRFHRTSSDRDTHDRNLNFWMRNSPVEPGGRASYDVTFRIDNTPGDWKHLLAPYKQYFNQTFGSRARYNVDFRAMAMTMPSNAELITPDNPYGTRYDIDTKGFGAYIDQRLRRLEGLDLSRVIFWSILASDRGANYRPDSNVLPPAVTDTLSELREFCREAGFGFGVFARPNHIAFRHDWDTDHAVSFNPLEASNMRMANNRYDYWMKQGATAFYMDTYGSEAMTATPMGGEAAVFYLQRLRERVGPDTMLFIEHGFDAMHLDAPIWPAGAAKLPMGEWARHLADGTVEVCRSNNLENAEKVWAQGGLPICPEHALGPEWMAVQRKYVTPEHGNINRPDCTLPTASPVP